MDTFFTFLKKSLVAMMFVIVGFSMTYIPQVPTSNTQEVHAGGLGDISTRTGQLIQNATSVAGNVINSITAGSTAANWFKENVLDGLGWAIAKRIVSGIIRSLIDWVNSGFQGRPAFIQDFKGFLLNIADEEIGRVISELGDIGSFICSPFRLDVQISVALQYSRGREQQSAPTCTLTGIIDNIQGFIRGIDPGNGLADWFTITSTPQTYTPYGAALSAQATARARIINAQGEERTLLDFGDGFQSQRICRSVSGFTGSQDCSIVKPGRVIADQLNKALGAGQDALIEADEINELIAALLGQLANKALQGAAGLLGLSGGDGFNGYSRVNDILENMVMEADQNVASSTGGVAAINKTLAREEAYRAEAARVLDLFNNAKLSLGFTPRQTNQQVDPTIEAIEAAIVVADANILKLRLLRNAYNGVQSMSDGTVRVDTSNNPIPVQNLPTDDQKVGYLIEFTELLNDPELNPEGADSSDINEWRATGADLGIDMDAQPLTPQNTNPSNNNPSVTPGP